MSPRRTEEDIKNELRGTAIQDISPEIIEQREKFLLYGGPKVGKTFCAYTSPDPIFALNVGGDNESKVYYSKEFQNKIGRKTIRVATAREQLGDHGRVDKPEGFDNATRLIDIALEDDARGEYEFQTLVIDNATILTEYQMYKAVYMSYRDKLEGGGKQSPEDTTYAKFMDEGLLWPYDSDWGGTQSLMSQFISWLFRIDKHIVLVAHEHRTEVSPQRMAPKQLVAVKPQFIGKDRDRVAAKFDNVWRFSREGQLYVARTEAQGSDPEIIAGTRLGGVVGRNYSDPNIEKTIELFRKRAKEVAANELKEKQA